MKKIDISNAMIIREPEINIALKQLGSDIRVKHVSRLQNGLRSDAYELIKPEYRGHTFLYYNDDWWSGSDEDIAKIIINTFEFNFKYDNCIGDPEYILKNVFPVLYSENRIPLLEKENRVLITALDLVVAFYIRLCEKDGHIYSVPLERDMIESLDIKKLDLVSSAFVNLEAERIVVPLNDYLVIGSIKGYHNGASVLMLESVLEDMREMLNADKMIIFPSSVREIIGCAKLPGMNVEELQDMVKWINYEVVSDDDKLSDSIYLWDGHDLTIGGEIEGQYIWLFLKDILEGMGPILI